MEPPKTKLPSSDPTALVNAMWNHASTMQGEFAKRHIRWPELTSQEVTDMLVYLRNQPSPQPAANIRIDSSGGEALFQSKGCAGCHASNGKLDLSTRLKHATLTDIAAAMWNHEPRMNNKSPAHFGLDEMQHLLGYLWAREFFVDSGDASRGARVFASKRCTVCHLAGVNGAPKLPAADREFSGAAMVSALWHHGPQMLAQMKSTGVAWPRFEGSQMADVIAYLNRLTPAQKEVQSGKVMTDSSSNAPHRPILILLTSHWISMLGAALVTFAGVFWLFVLPANIQGHVNNPYIGLLVFMIIPAIFFAGLVLIPIGIALARRQVVDSLNHEADRRIAIRRAGIFFTVMTVINVIIGSQVSYRAVAHMETTQFCGQSCHVMKPEFTAHDFAAHKSVACATCHIVPGAAGFVQAKMSGTRQLAAVAFNSFPRPIESAMESNRLVSSVETCEGCHARDRVIGNRLRVIRGHKSDETNSEVDTVLMMNVGGGRTGGIHGAHMGPGVQIRYTAADKKRQTISWVEYRNTEN